MILTPAARAAIDDLIESRHDALNLPGIALAVTDGNELLYSQEYGFADVAAGRPVTADTLFEIGSISKSFTAALVAQDALDGKLDLHAPLTDHLPWFSVRTHHDHPITAHHLLQHSAGIVTGAEASTEARSEVWALRNTDAIAEPGTWFHYSNVGYKTLGVVLEQINGCSYGDLLQIRILDRLGLERTSPLITNAVRPQLAIGYEAAFDDRPLAPGGVLVPATWVVTGTADGSIASTATDMAAYLRAWINPGTVFSRELLETVTGHTVAADRSVPDTRYGYGWQLCTIDGHRHLSHGGGMVGFRAHVVANLDARLGVVLLANGPGDTEGLALGVLAIVRALSAGEELPVIHTDDPTLVPETHDGDEANGDVLVGHWRSHNPWLTNFRTLRRDGQLLLTAPIGVESPADETVLVPLGDDRYRLGLDERSPERLTYSMFIDGTPHEVTFSGCRYHRTFTA